MSVWERKKITTLNLIDLKYSTLPCLECAPFIRIYIYLSIKTLSQKALYEQQIVKYKTNR